MNALITDIKKLFEFFQTPNLQNLNASDFGNFIVGLGHLSPVKKMSTSQPRTRLLQTDRNGRLLQMPNLSVDFGNFTAGLGNLPCEENITHSATNALITNAKRLFEFLQTPNNDPIKVGAVLIFEEEVFKCEVCFTGQWRR